MLCWQRYSVMTPALLAEVPLLSVLIPTYERPSAAVSQAASIRIQSLRHGFNVEVLLCDNSANPISGELIPEGVRYLFNGGNIGLSGSIQKMISCSTATYCWLLSDDDQVFDCALPRIYQALQACQSANEEPPFILLESSSKYKSSIINGKTYFASLDDDCFISVAEFAQQYFPVAYFLSSTILNSHMCRRLPGGCLPINRVFPQVDLLIRLALAHPQASPYVVVQPCLADMYGQKYYLPERINHVPVVSMSQLLRTIGAIRVSAVPRSVRESALALKRQFRLNLSLHLKSNVLWYSDLCVVALCDHPYLVVRYFRDYLSALFAGFRPKLIIATLLALAKLCFPRLALSVMQRRPGYCSEVRCSYHSLVERPDSPVSHQSPVIY